MWALIAASYATLAMAAANWAMWRASKRLELERMSEGGAFDGGTAKSKAKLEGGLTVRWSSTDPVPNIHLR